MKIKIKQHEIKITSIKGCAIAFNPNGDDYLYMWEHLSGLGFLNPSSGYGHSVEDCKNQVKMQLCSGN